MLKILLALWGSALIGRLLRHWPQPWVSGLLTYIIWVMLFCIGVEVGGNDTLMQSLGRLGWEALVATFIMVVTCAVGVSWFWRSYIYKKDKSPIDKKERRKLRERLKRIKISYRTLWYNLKDSLIIMFCFVIGCVAGVLGANEYLSEHATIFCLYLLMACVGFGIGQNRELLGSMKATKKKLLLMPLFTILFTWVGACIVSLVFSHYSLSEWLAVGSGFGYYSLSSILITEVKGAELGTIALLYNVLREILGIVLAPMWARCFGPLAPISVGGATTADTTLPAISRASGEEYVPVSIFHGILVDFTVPFLVPFFLAF